MVLPASVWWISSVSYTHLSPASDRGTRHTILPKREELLALAEKVLAGEVTHCPHGRPVMTVFTRAELDKRFGRIV